MLYPFDFCSAVAKSSCAVLKSSGINASTTASAGIMRLRDSLSDFAMPILYPYTALV